jgi:hypothetical protein
VEEEEVEGRGETEVERGEELRDGRGLVDEE